MTTTNVTSEVIGSVWKVEMNVGDTVQTGDVIMILESMKMEIPVEAPTDGKIADILVKPEDSVDEDQILCTIES
ncbi:MAG: acetyl-CoA carboxylase biotin carboxyl carrier protein subunit [Sneathiella sp.]|jgi:biotin carboxyl carrier protein|uniref:acetyl-CoA carboxylase biotin carboxyl carrier protein subunit n=1 Tax=Sneathiella sp. TaxID=1964365 RepID=UPI000C35FD12|nr:acetyl-CoA carboxylase biotin carboxyl carrier protein subunit [Sneathiella sp.]MAL77858.1 acetyl-CoA carboxylase biotin carboxyl carrier protein subunit [Sneathiella sp.]|tara:strand:- start:139 stop:360 length:222 start_codon:yes stop_codon:yes gene_type:complete